MQMCIVAVTQSASVLPMGSGSLASLAITMIGFTHYKCANLAISYLSPLPCKENKRVRQKHQHT